ncbi:Concanavalin A-like lectin/glucanase [Cordyceps fumosorosea ARSEF 2679]|uniref:Concanavalin A-like lectin/glucanase n=1 Tax=Cordyceps fumosorosea (strain ARSEF 2679) TaxID=1081104 RepID=A0A168AN54_CORFA|nr:Concanavalin A-like lectin/glucanase [Cordyceps fumosorosea ARSEF 2679]OAA68966.1 Concanavalin A-like lectin/glucanase [Cordyceps fumosorosea ARSEF 2679]
MKFNSALAVAGAIANSVGVAAHPSGASTVTNTHWSGAVLSSQGVTNVQGSVVVPNISGQSSDDSVAIWVGIDGAGGGTCGNTLMQAGLLVYGDGTIKPWYEWWQHEEIQFFNQDWDVQAGDTVFMQVQANSTLTGVTYLTNQRTGQTLTHQFESSESPGALCEAYADWVVEAISFETNNYATLPAFGTITITDTQATTNGGSATADSAEIWNMGGWENNVVNCKHAGSGAVSCTRG